MKDSTFNFLQYILIIIMVLWFCLDSYYIYTDNFEHVNLKINNPNNHYDVNGKFNISKTTIEDLQKITVNNKINNENININFYGIIGITIFLIIVNIIYYLLSKNNMKLVNLTYLNFVILLIIIVMADNMYYEIYKQHLSIVLQYIRGV